MLKSFAWKSFKFLLKLVAFYLLIGLLTAIGFSVVSLWYGHNDLLTVWFFTQMTVAWPIWVISYFVLRSAS